MSHLSHNVIKSIAGVNGDDPRAAEAHEEMHKEGIKDGLSSFVGLLEAPAYQTGGPFTGIDYVLPISYPWFTAQWRADADVATGCRDT
ncbi:hypothetical protein ACT3TS_04290 [Specibacter sp. AOP5-B1-6]|uniref:hypothetical protein n=1 Tax=Specibacter sp. AOP5-B1-6 TaxID=3457653 RepID=UPI00402B488E